MRECERRKEKMKYKDKRFYYDIIVLRERNPAQLKRI